MNHVLRLCLLLAASGAVAAGSSSVTAGPIATSTFDSGVEGWLVVSTEGHVGLPDWANIGGDHGGVIYDTDMDNGGWGFLAGPAFQVPAADAYGQLLMFDVNSNRIEHATMPVALADSAGIGIIAHVPTPAAVNTWAHREVRLDTTQGWHTFDYLSNTEGGAATAVQIQAVLGDLTYLFLGAEFANGYDDDGTYQFGELVAYDNVVLMPEPATMGLVCLGLAGLTMRRRRR